MGIKFNVLSDLLLNETSELKQFFKSSEPISFIHSELKLSHTAEPKLTPTDNRTVLQAALSEGRALFVKVLDPLRIMTSTHRTLQEVVNQTGKVSTTLQNIVSTPLPPASPLKMVNLITQELDSGNVYNDKLEDALKAFRSAITPGKFILIKRVPENVENDDQRYGNPEERRFSVFKRDPSQIGTGAKKAAGKVYGKQRFVAWYFSETAFLGSVSKSENVIAVYNEIFPGPNVTRETYILENETFLKTAHHPYISSPKGVQFEKLLPIEKDAITAFVGNTFKRFGDKLTEKIRQNSELLKQKVVTNLGSLKTPETELIEDMQEFRRALSYLEKGLNQIDPITLFKKFMLSDPRHTLSQYTFVQASNPYAPTKPYDGVKTKHMAQQDWQKMSSEFGARAVETALSGSNVRIGTPKKITVRPRNDPTKLIVTTTDKMKDPKVAQQYYMLDPRRQREDKKWIPVDPEYLGGSESTGSEYYDIAIAFTKPGEYNAFSREFMRYAMSTVIRTPKAATLRKALSLL